MSRKTIVRDVAFMRDRLELPIDLPETKSGTAAEQSNQVILTAAADGALLLNGAPVVQDTLEATIRELFAQRDDWTIFLEADRSLPYAKVVDLMDACRAAGVSRIGVLTRHSAGEVGALNRPTGEPAR